MQFDSTAKAAVLTKIGEITASVQALETVEPLQAQVDALTAQVTALTGQRDALQAQVSDLSGKLDKVRQIVAA